MRLLNEIFNNDALAATGRCTLLVGGGGYFEGVKTVGDFTPQRIVLYYPKAEIEVEGENLSIGKYYDGDLRLNGTIVSVRLVRAEKDKRL